MLNIFYCRSDLFSVYSEIENVFAIGYGTFDDEIYSKAKLYVPKGKLADYQQAYGWSYFTSIEEYDYSTDITTLQQGKDVKIVDSYLLNGQKRNAIQRGLNIIRMSDGSTKKLMVK